MEEPRRTGWVRAVAVAQHHGKLLLGNEGAVARVNGEVPKQNGDDESALYDADRCYQLCSPSGHQ